MLNDTIIFSYCEDPICTSLILQSMAGLHEIGSPLERRCGTKFSKKWTSDLIQQAFMDVDAPVQRKRIKVLHAQTVRPTSIHNAMFRMSADLYHLRDKNYNYNT